MVTARKSGGGQTSHPAGLARFRARRLRQHLDGSIGKQRTTGHGPGRHVSRHAGAASRESSRCAPQPFGDRPLLPQRPLLFAGKGGAIDNREPRINEQIRVPEVRLIGAGGEQIGITPLAVALRTARELDMDLVEVAAQARPPVCRVMDYGKYKYQEAVKAKEARKRQSHIVIKEMKMRPKIDKHDYATKSRHVERFLRDGSKVKATIMFRGREMAHQELGLKILERLAADMSNVAYVETAPSTEGRNMTMVLAPHKDGPRDAQADAPEAGTAAQPPPGTDGVRS